MSRPLQDAVFLEIGLAWYLVRNYPGPANHVKPGINCADTESALWCQSQITKKLNACHDSALRKVCAKSCGLCPCLGVHVFRSKCQPSGSAVETTVSYRPHPSHQMCTTAVKQRKINCEFCPVGQFSVVHACNEQSGQRHLARVQAQLIRNTITGEQRCELRVKHDHLPCAGCLAEQSDRQTVTACKLSPGGPDEIQSTAKLTVITEYMVNIQGCCRVQRSERTFFCGDCPPTHIEISPCPSMVNVSDTSYSSHVRQQGFTSLEQVAYVGLSQERKSATHRLICIKGNVSTN
ncbi:hypothetical protein AHF37_07351 [Paragonimus kellicotti]|nr:hypothetical protein AHF37_07351 [Paragonimus kellicotti]